MESFFHLLKCETVYLQDYKKFELNIKNVGADRGYDTTSIQHGLQTLNPFLVFLIYEVLCFSNRSIANSKSAD